MLCTSISIELSLIHKDVKNKTKVRIIQKEKMGHRQRHKRNKRRFRHESHEFEARPVNLTDE